MFHGSIVALVTPMQESGEIDFVSLRRLVDWHVASKTDAIVVTGTTGESPTLTHDEQLNIIKTVVEQSAGRIPVIGGTGSNSTQKTIELTREAMEIGVDACLLVTPYYNKPTQEGLYQHYRKIAESVPIPQILYNVPGRTGSEVLPETLQRLADIPNIVGIKEGRIDVAQKMLAMVNNTIDVYSGDDITALEIIKAGGKGVISVAANIVPKAMHDLCFAALNHDMQTASKLNEQLQALFKDLFVETNPIPAKWALYTLGLIPGGIRLPLTPLAECYRATIEETVKTVFNKEYLK